MPGYHKKNEPVKLPRYPGGKKALMEFLSANLRFPEEAMKAKISGIVIVGYGINDNGVVVNPHIIKSLGYGCDEEAIRVVSLLRYSKVHNRKIRITVSTKMTIRFNQSGAQRDQTALQVPAKEPKADFTVSYTVTPAPPAEKPASENAGQGGTYTWTINF